jgi:hypothetical protein
MRNAYKILVGKPEGKRPHKRPGCRWDDYFREDQREVRWKDVDWVHAAQNRDWWSGSIKQGFLDWLSDHQLLKDSAPWS